MGLQSVCSSGRPSQYYWRERQEQDHAECTARQVVKELRKAGYILQGNAEIEVKTQIKRRLKNAELGRLEPIDHVERIRRHPSLEMFEIRWQDVQVLRKDPVSALLEDKIVLIRLYHVEFHDRTDFVGLWVHEKIIADTNEQTSELQNQEIDNAKNLWTSTYDSEWLI